MNFKLKENGLIWENYANIPSVQKRQFSSEESEEKPDYIDLDDDGDTEESMKKASEDAMIDDSEDAEHFYDDNESDDVKGVVMSFDAAQPVESEYKEEEHDEDDHERNDMIKSEIKKLCEFANRLEKMMCDADFEEWMAAKITKAADYTSDVYFRLSTKADYANGSHEYDEDYEF